MRRNWTPRSRFAAGTRFRFIASACPLRSDVATPTPDATGLTAHTPRDLGAGPRAPYVCPEGGNALFWTGGAGLEAAARLRAGHGAGPAAAGLYAPLPPRFTRDLPGRYPFGAVAKLYPTRPPRRERLIYMSKYTIQ